jgi:hypothetical protein
VLEEGLGDHAAAVAAMHLASADPSRGRRSAGSPLRSACSMTILRASLAASSSAPPRSRSARAGGTSRRRRRLRDLCTRKPWRRPREVGASKSDITPAFDSTSTLVAANNTDGVWVAWSYVQDASAKNPPPTKGNDLWGYDPAQKIFVREKADNYAPGVITHLTSKGFVGDTVAWEGTVHTPKGDAPFKHTFKKLDDKTIEGRLYMGGQQFYLSTCKKG